MSSQSTLEWLREQQSRYIPKTPEQIRAEFMGMTFEQLRIRAGPPPSGHASDYYDPSHGEGNSGGAEEFAFNAEFNEFRRRGTCAPPYPLYNYITHPEAVPESVPAYAKWFSEWGTLLRKKWKEEHSSHQPAKKTVVKAVAKPVAPQPSMVSVVRPPTPPKVEVVERIPIPEEPVEDIFAKLKSFWDDDPIMVALNRGDIAWGDLDLYCPEVAQWEQDVEARRAATPAPVTPPPEPVAPIKVKHERVVPEFTPGIRTVITRNLPRDITVDMLRGAFEKYGPIKDIYIPKNMDKSSPYFGTVKGFALVKFLKSEHSAKAFTEEYGRLRFGKNNITVEFAKEDRN